MYIAFNDLYISCVSFYFISAKPKILSLLNQVEFIVEESFMF